MSRRRRKIETVETTEQVVTDLSAESLEVSTEPAPVLQVVKPLPKVALDVFATVGGSRWDQLAGFVYHAQKKKLGPLTIPEWREALLAFQNKPVG